MKTLTYKLQSRQPEFEPQDRGKIDLPANLDIETILSVLTGVTEIGSLPRSPVTHFVINGWTLTPPDGT